MPWLFLLTGAPAPPDVRVISIMNRTAYSIVTIEWTPPPEGSIAYTVTALPTPVNSRHLSNSSLAITLRYNTEYVVEVTNPMCGGLHTAINFSIGQYGPKGLQFRFVKALRHVL